ncbi:hypothetical protein RhiirA4_550447, partial [Rhizophagus irregularis]
MLIDNNVFSDNEDISSFPFIKVSDDLSHEDYAHFLVKLFESLKSHLADFSIPCLLTPKGDDIIEGNRLSEWVQNINNDLEIIEFNNIIPLYDILEVEQKKEIDIILNKRNNFRIIMTGSIDLKDSDITKQLIVGIRPPVENKNYEIFGSIVSKNNSKLKDIFVTFGSYEIDQFTATIRTSKKINIKDYYILWMMIGNPSELSVFGPNNREIQVEYVKQSIKLQRNNSYSITTHQLSQGYDISIKCFKPIEIKFAGWSKNCVHLNISNPKSIKSDIDNVEIAICVLNSGHEKSWIDINAKKYSIGCILTENNYLDIVSNAQKYLKTTYPTKKEREKETMLVISKKNLENHLDLSEFVNLEKLNCSGNDLTSLDISKNKHLTEIDCSQNKIISLDLSNCLYIKSITANCNQLIDIRLPIANSEKLEYLNLLDNSFSQNLNYFSRFVNLKELLIGSIDGDRIQQGKFNKFYGSMKPLKSMIKLKSLSINNTDIDSGLEFLPDCITNFRCLADKRSEAKVKKIYDQLGIYTSNSVDAFQGRYNLKAWKENWKIVKEKEALQNQIKQVEKLSSSAELNELEKEESNLIAKEVELVEKNNHLEVEIKNLEQETNNLKQLVNKLNAKLKQKEVAYQQTKEQLEEKEEKLKSFTGEKLENFTNEKLMEKEELNKEIGNLKKMLLDKEKDVEQSEKQLEEINTELETKEKESDNLKNELDNIKSSLTEIQNKKAELSKLKKKLDHEKKFSKTGTSGLRKQMDDLKNDLKLSQSKKAEAEAKAREMEDLLNEQNSRRDYINELKSDKKNLEEELEIRKSQTKDKQDLINKNEQQNEEKINALENELKEKEELINNLRQQKEEKIISLNNEIRDKEKLNDKLNEETKKCQDSLKEITALNNQLKNKNDSINKLQKQTDELTRLLNEDTEKYQNSKREISALLPQIQTQQTELNELVNNVSKKHDLGKKGRTFVDNILEKQRNVIQTNENSASEELEKIRRKLIDDYEITEEEIRDILHKQAEKAKLDMQLKSIIQGESSSLNTKNDQLNEHAKNLLSKQQIIQKFKLNHGLFLDGYSIKASKKSVYIEDGKLNISLCKEQPFLYTFINDRDSQINLLSFNSNNNDVNNIKINKSLQLLDMCINFPVAEITYTADLSESFKNFMDDNEIKLYEMYGHLFPRKILIGGKLFIDDLKSATSTQINMFKSFLTWVYDSAKYKKAIPFNNFTALKFFPKITTSDGENLNTYDKLTNWMNNLYQKNSDIIISYNNLVPISELRFGKSSSSVNEMQPGVANFKEKLSLREWVKDSIYINLTRWIKEFRLFQGQIINKHLELENSKKIAVNFINVPNVNSSDKLYLEMIKPITTLEDFFKSNNVNKFLNKDMTLLPFIKNSIQSVNLSYEDYTHFMIKCERYRILLSKADIKPSEEFEQAIERALENMKPFTFLQDVFDNYGYFYPLNIVLGKSLKNILPNSSLPFTFKKMESSFESLTPFFDNFNVSYFLTKKGNTIEKDDLPKWIQSTNNDLEIIEFDNVISLYDILKEEQQRNINIILNTQNNTKVIMTGIVDLKDLNIDNTEHYKRININPSFENGKYEVFGSIISKDKKENLKSDFFVRFGLYDTNGFSAMIKTLNKNSEINITECYILWMITGIPSELLVF